MLDGIFHDGLQGQRRQSEARVRRIELNKQLSLKAYLLYRQISPHVLQLLGKGYRSLFCDRREILSQIIGKIQGDLLRLGRVLLD